MATPPLIPTAERAQLFRFQEPASLAEAPRSDSSPPKTILPSFSQLMPALYLPPPPMPLHQASRPAVLSISVDNPPSPRMPFTSFMQDLVLPSGEVNDLMKKGREALQSQRFADASEYYSQAMLKDPKNSRIDLGLADVAWAQGKINSAEVALLNALKKDSNNQVAYWRLQNVAHYKSSQPQVPIHPANAPVVQASQAPAAAAPSQPRLLRAEVRQFVGRKSGKDNDTKKGEGSKKDETTFQYQRALLKGRTALLEGKAAKAEKCYQAAVILTKKNSDAYVGLGEVAKLQNQDALALQYFSKALEQDPANANAMIERGTLKLQLKEYDDAAKDFKAVLDTKDEITTPNALRSLVEIANIYRQMGAAALNSQNNQAAQAFYMKAVQLESYRFPTKVRKSASEPNLHAGGQEKGTKKPRSSSDETTQAS